MRDDGNDAHGPPNPGDGFGTGTAAVVWLLLAGVFALVLFIVHAFSGNKKKQAKAASASSGNAAPAAPRQVGGARRVRRMRVRREEESDDDDWNAFDDSGGGVDPVDFEDDEGVKIGAKKARKLEMKAEKKAQREAELEEREEKKKREALLEAERKKDAERRAMDDAARAEEELLRKEEQERKEHEEYLQLKASFVVEESGEVGIMTEEESQSLLQEFINFIKDSKVVQLEDLGARFNLKTQEAIDRLEHLLGEGRLTGIMDDRGKFIYISEEELQGVAKFIKQRGRISIADLAESSNSLINMEGVKAEQPAPVLAN